MRREACSIGVTGVVALLFLVLPALADRSDAQVLRYVVRADPFEVELSLPDGTKQVKRPGREATYFYFLSENGWPVPDGVSDKPVRCEIRWDGFPAGWRLMNSFGIDRRTQEFTTTLGELRKAVFAGGDFRIARSKKGLFLVTRGAWRFPDLEATDLLDRIAEAQTAIWRDRGLSGHLVYLLATNESAGHWQGEARTQSMVVQMSRDTATPADVAHGLAHELFHEWNAHRLNRSEDERLYWFTEGVTDYYATVTLWRSGIWNLEQVLSTFNTVARQYFGSPVRNYTADRMAELRKSDSNVERLPYLQGFLLASHWNTDGRILDRVLRNLMKTNREPLSNQRIADALRSTGLTKAGGEIERFVVRGETIELRPRIWGDCAAESGLDVKQFDMGFDLDESRKTGIIQGVRESGNAWQAGVRNGQRWAPMDVVLGDPGYLAELEIRDGQRTHRVKYYPVSSSTVHAPQYTATSTGSCDLGARSSSSPR
jgi:predicted metalloprotease with PDZ domain